MHPLRSSGLVALLMLAFLPGAGALRGAAVAAALTTAERRDEEREARLVVEMLQNLQYADRQLVDIDAREIIDQFVRRFDPDAVVLRRDEIEFLHRRYDRQLKSVYLRKGDLQPAYEIFDDFVERARRRLEWIKTRLSAGLDLTVAETMPVVRDEAAEPAPDAATADRRWELRLKAIVIASMLEGRGQEAAQRKTAEAFARWGRQLEAMDAPAVREVFLDVFAGLFDPHSGYSSAENAEEFATAMRGLVGGAGLAVRLDEGRCLVDRVLPGGPAEEEGSLTAGDELIAAAAGDGDWVELAGKRLPAVLARLRGPVDSTLRLAWRRGDASAPRAELTLKRRNVVLIEDRARGAVVQVVQRDGSRHPVGWIDLPAFYASGEGEVVSSASRDVRELLEQMAARGIEGVVVDLRRNPGGAMTEAIRFAGLFAPGRTVLVTRGIEGKPEEMKSDAGPPAYAGPLVLLVSRASASASEIVAGTLRGDGRALIVGAPATFGKGTSQNYLDLNRSPARVAGAGQAWGTLRLTAQRFYFPDGSSPQLVGAAADIVLPMPDQAGLKAERDLPHALAAESIGRPALVPLAPNVARIEPTLLDALRARAQERAATLREFALDRRREEVRRAAQAKTETSVELAARRAEFAADMAVRDAWLADCRAVAAEAAWAWSPVETKAVGEAIARHERCARRWQADGAGWLHGGVYFAEDENGRLRQAELAAIEFRMFEPQAPTLAAAFAKAAGREFGTEAIGAALRRMQMLDVRTDRAVEEAFAAGLPTGSLEPERVRRGVAAVLGEMVRIEPSLLQPERALDVAARESLRLAADWAALRPAPAVAGPSSDSNVHP